MASPERTESSEYYPGRMFRRDSLLFRWLVKKVIARVKITDQSVVALREWAGKGTLIYTLKQNSQLDSLIVRELALKNGFPCPAYVHGVNMLLWQPFGKAIRTTAALLARLFRKSESLPQERTDYLRRLALSGESLIIPVGETEFTKRPEAEEALTQLLQAQQQSEAPLIVVPILITYGRRRDIEQESLVNILFGQTENTGSFRRIITFLRYANKISVMTAEPVYLNAFLAGHGDLSPQGAYRTLRRDLIEHLDEEKRSIVGPILKSRDTFINLVLEEEGTVRILQKYAAEEQTPYEAVVRQARKYLEEIAADYDETYIEFFDKFLTWLWNNIYDGLIADRDGLEQVRILSKRMPFVIVPCHRSHIDYLVLDYVLYKNHLQLPFIAAGTNLLVWPLGHIFRKCGAFFMRRTFKGNPLYADIFAKYLKTLLKEGIPIEFFIEGGRSRTGKMIMPKYGLLSMIIQAFKDHACDDLAIVPVYIGYDRVIEEKAYLKELGGAAKEQEKTTDVIQSSKVLRKRYGHVYVNIGAPLLLKAYLAGQEKSYEDMGTEERQSLYRKIGYEIVLEISKVSVVTPFALLSAGFLSNDRRGISHGDLMTVVDTFQAYLAYRHAKFAASFSDREKALRDAIGLFIESNLISRVGAEDDVDALEEVVYSLDEEKRLSLEYYKNNILHFFVPLSFLALIILSRRKDTIPLQDIMEDYLFLKRLFRHEFIFDDQVSEAEEVSSLLSHLQSQGMIRTAEYGQKLHVEVRGLGRTDLTPFAGLISNYIESYWVVIRGCQRLRNNALSEKTLLKTLLDLGQKLYNKGEIRHSEALSQSNYQNALRFLQDVELVNLSEVMEKGAKRPSRHYSLTGNREQLEQIRRRVFKFL